MDTLRGCNRQTSLVYVLKKFVIRAEDFSRTLASIVVHGFIGKTNHRGQKVLRWFQNLNFVQNSNIHFLVAGLGPLRHHRGKLPFPRFFCKCSKNIFSLFRCFCTK